MQWWVWLIIVVVVVAVLAAVAFSVNRAFRRRYGVSLFGGGFLLLIGVASVAGGIVLGKNGMPIGYALLIVTAITFLFTLIYDFKKCGGAGIVAFLLQLVFCIPSLLIIFDVLFNRGRATLQASIDEDIRERRRDRRRRRQDDYYNDNNRYY